MTTVKKAKKLLLIVALMLLALIVLYLAIGFILFAIDERERVKSLELTGDIITITEEEYVHYLEELYIHSERYIGKQVVMEGLYDYVEEEGVRYHFVGREIEEDEPCEEDHEHAHMVGLEFFSDAVPPVRGTQIRVTGILAEIEENGEQYLVLDHSQVEIVAKEQPTLR